MNKSKRRLQLAAGIISILMALGSVLIGLLVAALGTFMSWMMFGLLDALAGSNITEMGALIFLMIGIVMVLIIGIPLFVCGVLLCKNPVNRDGTVSSQAGRVITSTIIVGLYLLALIGVGFAAPPILLLAILPGIVFICLVVSLTKKHNRPAEQPSGGGNTNTTSVNVTIGSGNADESAPVVEVSDKGDNSPSQ
ncbi:MAG: hypothetical protein LBN07_00920 [Christensenellaceae bacterium]|jgi:hypothetical protein|nr:hypothetical protein [Christensenellaceae bacterium]